MPVDLSRATPRPWRLVVHKSHMQGHAAIIWTQEGPGFGAVARTANGGMICTSDRWEESEANAALIVEAVNSYDDLHEQRDKLLEACRAIEYWLSDLHPDNLPCCFPKKLLRDAIAHAEGGEKR